MLQIEGLKYEIIEWYFHIPLFNLLQNNYLHMGENKFRIYFSNMGKINIY
jgi:hypothetical protein